MPLPYDDPTEPSISPAPLDKKPSDISPSDIEIVERVLAGDVPVFETIMRRYNQRLYRVARSIIGQDDEAEDIVQETYVNAFEHLRQYKGHAAFATWLTRIAVHAALARRKQRERLDIVDLTDPEHMPMISSANMDDGQHEASNRELGRILTVAVDGLPEELRMVFVLRIIQGMDTNETAECLGLTTANVKTRLHRARTLLQERIDERIGVSIRHLYQFGGERCDRIVYNVFARLTCQ